MNDPVVKRAIVMSGLPAGGKTTIGVLLAQSLGFDFVDKDDFLEALYEECGIGDESWRQTLSNESNLRFEAAAKSLESAVLVSHWRPLGVTGPSGTSLEWINKSFDIVVEAMCECPTEVAKKRFITRQRHDGHLDKNRKPDEVSQWMMDYSKRLPLGIGPLVKIDATAKVDVWKVVGEIKLRLQS